MYDIAHHMAKSKVMQVILRGTNFLKNRYYTLYALGGAIVILSVGSWCTSIFIAGAFLLVDIVFK